MSGPKIAHLSQKGFLRVRGALKMLGQESDTSLIFYRAAFVVRPWWVYEDGSGVAFEKATDETAEYLCERKAQNHIAVLLGHHRIAHGVICRAPVGLRKRQRDFIRGKGYLAFESVEIRNTQTGAISYDKTTFALVNVVQRAEALIVFYVG
jgi:hypothetical protein